MPLAPSFRLPARRVLGAATVAAAVGTVLLVPGTAVAAQPVADPEQLVITFAEGQEKAPAPGTVIRSDVVGDADVRVVRQLGTGALLVEVEAADSPREIEQVRTELRDEPAIEAAERDVVVTAQRVPTDPDYDLQWHHFEPVGGSNSPGAWDLSTGAGVVVAVVDSGIVAHEDLGNTVAGYDFITSAATARDGGGRDADPRDEGTYGTAAECGSAQSSSWHGTFVGGIVAAGANAVGGVGVAFDADVQPVRALGRCGSGSLVDIADAIVWASGGTVSGVPANPTPAKVINLSLGGAAACPTYMADAIAGARSRGAVVVVSAGNGNNLSSTYAPANCAGSFVVAANDREGNRAAYSSYGPIVDVTAPGGETAVAGNGTYSTRNAGTSTPTAATNAYGYSQGTSFSAPHVAGLAALVIARRPGIAVADVERLIVENARPLPGTCTGGCGAGIIDAAATLAAT